jgi:hypothetical protein
LIERECPTGLIVTTQTGLDPELETRLLSLTVTHTAAQTKAVMQALARSRSSSDAVPVDSPDFLRENGLNLNQAS